MRRLLLGLLLLFSFTVHAEEVTDSEVADWAKNTLIYALSVDFNYQPTEAEKHSKGFTRNAWNAINIFLGGYMRTIHADKLSIHPQIIEGPTIVDSGTVSGIRFWRVNQVVLLPELNIRVAFSFVILATVPSTSGSFIVQSMDMVKLESQ